MTALVLLGSCPGGRVRIDSEDLRNHYASLADEELAAINPDYLTEAATAVYEAELARRGLTTIQREEEGPTEAAAATREPEGEVDEFATSVEGAEPLTEFDIDTGPPPEWLEDAACACSFESRPGDTALPPAVQARLILRRAGIPCRLTVQQEGGEDQSPAADRGRQSLICVMVPGGLALHATSILDQEMFNEEKEESWRNHFEELSDDELQALNPEVLCAGYLDLVGRLRRAYEGEIARRRLRPRDTSSRGAGAGG